MVDKYQKSIKLFVAKSSCRAEIFETLQTYKGFSRVIYSILNGSAILERNETRLERNETRLERNETRLERNETRLERNETRLARNETRGGKLPLSGTVDRSLICDHACISFYFSVFYEPFFPHSSYEFNIYM